MSVVIGLLPLHVGLKPFGSKNSAFLVFLQGHVLKAIQSSIHVPLWMLVDDVEQDFDHKRRTYGYLIDVCGRFLVSRN